MPGGPEVMVILLMALLVLGPEQLPKAMRTLGKARTQFERVSGGLKAEVMKAMEADEREPADRTP